MQGVHVNPLPKTSNRDRRKPGLQLTKGGDATFLEKQGPSSSLPIFSGKNFLESVPLRLPPHCDLVRKDGGSKVGPGKAPLQTCVCLGACAGCGDKAPSSFTDLTFSPWGPPGLVEGPKGLRMNQVAVVCINPTDRPR